MHRERPDMAKDDMKKLDGGIKHPEMPAARRVIISADRVEWNNFANVYEVLGFVDLHVHPDAIKQAVLKAAKDEAEKGSKTAPTAAPSGPVAE